MICCKDCGIIVRGDSEDEDWIMRLGYYPLCMDCVVKKRSADPDDDDLDDEEEYGEPVGRERA